VSIFQLPLRIEFLKFHLAQGGTRYRKYAQFGIHTLLVQLLVPFVKRLEFRVTLAACVDFTLGLTFKHDEPPIAFTAQTRTPRPERHGALLREERRRPPPQAYPDPQPGLPGLLTALVRALGTSARPSNRPGGGRPPGQSTLRLPKGRFKGFV
jgi:hypothetical protein